MTTTKQIEDLNKLSLKDFTPLYATLEFDAVLEPGGVYRATFVGPGWLRAIAGPGLVIGGLGGWWGKRFNDDGTAVNLVYRDGELKPRYTMTLIKKSSALDGQPALVLTYGSENPLPWPYVMDELRPLAKNTYLGMTFLNVDSVPKLALPFVLEHHEPGDGL